MNSNNLNARENTIDMLTHINNNNDSNFMETTANTNKGISVQDVKNAFPELLLGKEIGEENEEENEEKIGDNASFPSLNKKEKAQKTLFLIKGKKRGRKTIIRSHPKIHGNDHFDNIKSKIQVHFISFIINLSNDALSTAKTELKLDKKFNFKQIAYSIKLKINFKNSSEFINSTIKDILKNEISPKFKKCPKNINETILNIGTKSSMWLKELFNLNYLDLFIYYYNEEKPLKELNFYGKKIVLSKKTQGFYDLLKKKENEKLKSKLINAVKSSYFYAYDTQFGRNPFESNKIS